MKDKRNIQIAKPSLDKKEWLSIKDSILSGWLTQGPKVKEFEKKFASRHNVEYAIAVSSCTTGLHLSLLALDIGPGDEVLVPAFTWVATANVVTYCGAKPIFVDIEKDTFNININSLRKAISKNTKAIIVVHLFGLCVNVKKIRNLIPKDIKIIEDAACAIGSSHQGESAGSLGDVASFSFHPRKTITTGEGGMVTTNNKKLAILINQLRNHGAKVSEEERHNGPKPYILPDFNLIGYNFRMTDLQGSIGLVQMEKLDKFLFERNKLANYYNEKLKKYEWMNTPHSSSNSTHGWQSYVVYIEPKKAPQSRNVIMDKLHLNGVSTRPGTHAVHMLNIYKKNYNIKPSDYPIARNCEENTLALPLHNEMDEQDIDYIVCLIDDMR